MSKSLLEFEQSEWWILPMLIVSASLSYFLYHKKDIPWTKFQNWVLFGIRALAIFLLLFLLLDPNIKRVTSSIEPPVIGIAIDNSQSIVARGDDSLAIKETIRNIQDEIGEDELVVEMLTLNNKDLLQFDGKTSNLSSLLSLVDETNQDNNHVATLLFTDGIYNRGSSPLYKNYVKPIFTIGMGDTIPPKDISLSRVRYNRVSYKGNEMPIQIEINQEGYLGQEVELALTENGKLLESKNITLKSSVQEIEFVVANEEEGLRHLIVSISYQEDESSNQNNSADIFLEVIDGSQKVLIVASSPHPDVKSIRATLEKTDNYETSIYIPAIEDKVPNEIFDVIIYHGAFNSRLSFDPKGNPGTWYILNVESNLRSLNNELPYLNILRKGGQPDKVTGSFNQRFSKFKVENIEIFEDYPPIQVPYADYAMAGSSEVLMFQRLGSVTTNKPLMIVYDDGSKKSATLMGQGIWKWKLQEAAINENSESFDDFIMKTIQFLSVKNDKEQFRFIPRSSIFQDASPVLFDAEVYNDIYERIYGSEIAIKISNNKGESQDYAFAVSELNSTFQAPNLSPGIYQYEATVQVGSKNFGQKGQFLIENTNTEYIELTANHRLLKNLSSKTNGEYVHFSEVSDLVNMIKERDFKPLIKSEEELQRLISTWWWYLLIFSLFSVEWVLRRYWGGY